jgi:ACS family 4-hydroxyphenylacetate permease-like MFS transporter
MMAQPVAMALGGAGSGLILQHFNGVLGLQGWRWMFLLEGLPAVLLGVMAYFYLTDKPKDAKWLTKAEKEALAAAVAQRKIVKDVDRPRTPVLKEVMQLRILLLAAAYFCLVNTINANATWIPTIVREVLKAYSLTSVGFITAIPAICAFILMPIWTRSSDRMQERPWHVIVALAMATVGWLTVIFFPAPELRLVGLIFTVSGAFCAMSVFWTLPQAILSEEARPAGIGLISAVGLLGSAVSPAVIGILRDATGSFKAGLFYVAALLAISAFLVWIVGHRNKVA